VRDEREREEPVTSGACARLGGRRERERERAGKKEIVRLL
jgi:hypothetical protein